MIRNALPRMRNLNEKRRGYPFESEATRKESIRMLQKPILHQGVKQKKKERESRENATERLKKKDFTSVGSLIGFEMRA